jgi:excisionase family DNA binding protein
MTTAAARYQAPERYLLPQEVGAVIPGRVAALIYATTDLAKVRTSRRGVDPEVDAALMALAIAALRWRSSATGTEDAPTPEPPASSSWLTTTQAAGLAGVTDRAVRKAIAAGQLDATNVGGRYRISRENLEQYRARRNKCPG